MPRPRLRRRRGTRRAIVLLSVVTSIVVIASLIAANRPGGHSQTAASTPRGINLDADNVSAPPAAPAAKPAWKAPTPKPTARSAFKTAIGSNKWNGAAKYLVLFVLDGARPDYYTVPGIPHIRALMKQGTDYINGFAGILESETPSGHATIVSGSPPRTDGILSFAWANSDNTTVNLFDPNNILNHQMENIIRDAPASNIAELVHKHDSHAEVAVLGGHKYYAQDAMGGPSANTIVYYTGMPNGTFAPVAVPGHVPPASILQDPALTAKTTHLAAGAEDRLVMKLVMKTVNTTHPRILMVNVPEFDWPLGHVDGGDRDPAVVKTLMQGFDKGLGKLENAYRKAGILNKTEFVLTSDHGFAPIYHTVSKTAIEQAVAASGTNIISDTFHTASYLWIRDASRAAVAAENVAKLQNPYIQSVYFKESMAGGGYRYVRATGSDLFHVPGAESANQYLLQTFDGPNGPDVAVFFTEDSASEPGGQANWKGDHGGAAWQSQHLRIVISGAGVKSGVVSSQPAPLEDLAPTVLSLLGIQPTGMQGVALADGMSASTAAERAAEATQGLVLRPVISALKAESRAELAARR